MSVERNDENDQTTVAVCARGSFISLFFGALREQRLEVRLLLAVLAHDGADAACADASMKAFFERKAVCESSQINDQTTCENHADCRWIDDDVDLMVPVEWWKYHLNAAALQHALALVGQWSPARVALLAHLAQYRAFALPNQAMVEWR